MQATVVPVSMILIEGRYFDVKDESIWSLLLGRIFLIEFTRVCCSGLDMSSG